MEKDLLFDYFLFNLAKYQGSDLSRELEDISMARIHNILFLVCLLEGLSLFQIFDKFEMYRNGPREVQMMERRRYDGESNYFRFNGRSFIYKGGEIRLPEEYQPLGAVIINSLDFIKNSGLMELNDTALQDFINEQSFKDRFYYYSNSRTNIGSVYSNDTRTMIEDRDKLKSNLRQLKLKHKQCIHL